MPGQRLDREGVRPGVLPDGALLQRYRQQGAYTDCYTALIARDVTHEQFVAAFYCTPVFRLERLILRFAIARPSTDEQARQLAAGTLDRFAAWNVEARAENQLLLCDLYGRTRSWLMTAPMEGGTRLYFGSAVVPRRDDRTGAMVLGSPFSALLGFHKLYSRILLAAAKAGLRE